MNFKTSSVSPPKACIIGICSPFFQLLYLYEIINLLSFFLDCQLWTFNNWVKSMWSLMTLSSLSSFSSFIYVAAYIDTLFFLWPNNISFLNIPFCLFIHKLIKISTVSIFFYYKLCCYKRLCTSLCLDMFGCLRYITWSHIVTLSFNFWGTDKLVSNATALCIPTNNVWMFPFLNIPANTFFILAILVCGSGIMSFWFAFPWWIMMLIILSFAYWSFVIFFWRNVYADPLPIF